MTKREIKNIGASFDPDAKFVGYWNGAPCYADIRHCYKNGDKTTDLGTSYVFQAGYDEVGIYTYILTKACEDNHEQCRIIHNVSTEDNVPPEE